MIHRPPYRTVRLILLSLLVRYGPAALWAEPAAAESAAPAAEPGPVMAAPAPALPPMERSSADIAAEARGLLALGHSLTERKDFPAAEIAYRRILSSHEFLQAHQIDALIGLARMYRIQGTYSKAAAIYEKYLREFPDDDQVSDVMLDLGRTLRAMGAYRMAISRFYGVLNTTLKLPAEGFDHYELLARTAQFEIAETHFASGNFAEASKFFSRLRLLDLAPVDQARAHYKAAYAMQLAGNLEGAVTSLHEYLDLWPGDEHVPEARHLLAVTLRLLNRKEEAMAVTLELLQGERKGEVSSSRWIYWQRKTGNQLANDFFQGGDTPYALAIYQGLANLATEPAWRLPIAYQIGLCQERLRAAEQARAAYQGIVDEVARLQPAPEDLADLAQMAAWRLSHLAWSGDAERNLAVFFSTGGPGPTKIKPPQPNDSHGSAPTASAGL